MSQYCELGVGLLDMQPVNAVSNLGLLISGVLTFLLVRRSKVEVQVLKLAPVVIFGAGLGSLAWHGYPHPFTYFLDVFFIYCFVGLMFFYLLRRIFPDLWKTLGVMALVLLAELPFLFGWLPDLNGFVPYTLAFLMALGLVLVAYKKVSSEFRPLFGVLALFAFSLFFRTIDLYACEWIPFGTHLMWHLLNALVTYWAVKVLVGVETKKKH